MRLALVRSTLTQHAVSILGFTAACLFYSVVAVVIFQKVISRHRGFVRDNLNALLSTFTPARDVGTVGGFIGSEYLSFLWVLMVLAFVTLFAARALAADPAEAPLDLLLAYPVARIGLLSSRLVALTAGLAVLVAGTVAGLWAAALSQHLRLGAESLAGVAGLCLALGLAIAGYTFVLAAVLPRMALVAAVAWPLTTVLYAVDVASRNFGLLNGLDRLSIFHYFSPAQALDSGRVDWAAVTVLLGVAAAGWAVSALVFRRRDLPGLHVEVAR